jgi:hypothetical protein
MLVSALGTSAVAIRSEKPPMPVSRDLASGVAAKPGK